MKNEIIKSITEAFSMQPATYYVGMPLNNSRVAKIELEVINFPVNGDSYNYRYYVGRDEQGNKMFQFRAETVSVIFQAPTQTT